MKNKFLFLTAAIASCISATAAPSYPVQNINGGRSCYDRNMCTGSPNAWGGGVCGNQINPGPGSYAVPTNSYGYSEAGQDGTKVLQAESTENFVGIVKSVNKVALPNQTQIQVVLETNHGDLLVIVGPSQFVDQAKIKLQAGDKITVTGYRVKANGNDVILAAEIKGSRGGSIQLRDANRQPIWGGKAGEYRRTTSQYSSTQTTYSQPIQNTQNKAQQQYSGSQNPNMPNSRQ